MPAMNPKNAALSSQAGVDLGLGDQLSQQVQDEVENAKNESLKKQGLLYGDNGAPGLSVGMLGLGVPG